MRPSSARFVRTGAALLASIALLASCDDSAGPVSPAVDAAVQNQGSYDVRADSADAVMMVRTPSAVRGARGGTTLRLSAAKPAIRGTSKLPTRREVRWISSDTLVATVTADGVVMAQDTGEVSIIAKEKTRADTTRILVVPVPVVTVTVAGADSVLTGDTAVYTAAAFDSVGVALPGRLVTWTSSTPSIGTVSAAGEAVGLAAGNTEISATVGGKSATRVLRVLLQPVASVTVEPAELSLAQFRKTTFRAIARDGRGRVLANRTATWATSDTSVFAFRAGSDTLVALDVGSAVLTATVEGKSGASTVTVTSPVEARALWVTRFEYTGSAAVDFTKIATIMQKAASANFNVVYFQVRTSGDALYYSSIEPCSPRMCGTLGGARPAQDPLEVALREAAKYGIQVHAWLNAYTGFIAGSTTACNQFINSTPANWLKAHPEWSVSTKNFSTGVITRQVDNCATTSEYMWVSPGVPQVRAQVATVSADIARRYGPLGLKGIHLDRIRYPSNTVSYDSATQEAFRAATGAFPTSNAQATWLDFRRGLVNQGVREVYEAVRAVDPSMVLSAAVFPGYKARAGWSAQWSYSDLFQDPQAWAQGGYLDVEVPMNYPATATSASWTVKAYCSNTDWTCVMDDHIARIEGQSGRQVYVGVGAITGWTEMKKQIDLAHDRAVTGMSVYSFSQVDAIPNGWSQLAAGPFKNKATIPAMAWKN